MRFTTTVMLGGKTATGFEVPEEVVQQLGKGKRPPVNVTINDYTYRSTVCVMSGAYFLPLSAENRTGAGVHAGERIDVDLELDDQPRIIQVPADLQAAIDGDAQAKEFFDSLSYSNKRWHVQQMEGAKSPETRLRRIERSLQVLRARKTP